MSKNVRKAIVLGGTSPHVLLIEKLKNRGYYTILVDYLDNSPGRKVADEYICASTLDLEKVLEIAKEEKVSLVISTCIDQANVTCCYVSEKLDLPRPYSYDMALNVTDKSRMKKIMIENDIPTSEYEIFKDVENINWQEIQFPSVVKPVDSNSSKGVHRVDSVEEAVEYAKEAISISRTNTALIERFNEGREIQVDCVAMQDGAEVIMTRQKQKIMSKNGMVLQSFGSIVPAPLSEELNRQIKEIAEKIAKSFELKNTPFFYQAIVSQDNQVNVLEFAPRVGGGLSYHLIKNITGFDVVEAAVKSFLGEEIIVETNKNHKKYSTNLLYMLPGIFDHIEGMEKLQKDATIKEFFVTKEKGTVIDADMRSGNRVGAFIVEADNYDELESKAKKAFASIEVVSAEGRPSLNRQAYVIDEEK